MKFKWNVKTGEVKFENGKTIQLESSKEKPKDKLSHKEKGEE